MAGSSLGRLRKGREFDSVYSEGTVIGGPLFVLRVRPNECGRGRWGFAVGKKLAPHSVVRNRQRRRLRAAVRVVGPGSHDFILTARPKLLDASYAEILSQLRRSLSRVEGSAPS